MHTAPRCRNGAIYLAVRGCVAGRCWLYRRRGATHDRPFHRRRSATLAKTLRRSARSPAGPTLLTVDPKARPPDASTLLPPTPVRSVHHSAYWFTRRVSTQEVLAVGWTVWSVGTLVGRYGTVTSLHIPKKDEAGAGKIFVEYLQMDQAECTTALRTRYRSAALSSTLCTARPTSCMPLPRPAIPSHRLAR
jgi:hypothetical protein